MPLKHWQDLITFLGNLFQCMTNLSVKKYFLLSSVNLPWHSLELFLHVLSLTTREKSSMFISPPQEAVEGKLQIRQALPALALFLPGVTLPQSAESGIWTC